MRKLQPRSLLFKEPSSVFTFVNEEADDSVLFTGKRLARADAGETTANEIDFPRDERLVEEFIDSNDPFHLNDELDLSEVETIEYGEPVVSDPPQADPLPHSHTTNSWEDFFDDINNDSFIKQRKFKLQSALLSESHRNTFEAVLRLYHNNMNTTGLNKLVSQTQLTTCLYYLIIGVESPMFKFDKRRMRFSATSKYRLIACSQEIIDKIANFFIECGSRLKRLQYTSEVILDKGNNANSILYAFSTCLNRVIYRIEKFALKAFSQNQSPNLLLKLYSDFQEPAKVVTVLATILGCADVDRSPRLNRLPDCYRLLDEIYHRAVIFESSDDRLCSLIRLVLLRTSSPWLPEVGQLIGLGSKEIFSRASIDISKSDILFLDYDVDSDLLVLNKKKVPIFLDISLAKYVLETVNCFLVIMRYGNEELRSRVYHLKTGVELKWCVRFDEASREEILPDIPPVGLSDSLFGSDVDFLLKSLTSTQISDPTDSVESIVDNTLYAKYQSNQNNVPMEMAAQLSFSAIICSQWKLANQLVMDVFTKDQSIIDHARLIQEIYFLNNGELVIRLEEIIFGTIKQGGLGLDRTSDWPPPSGQINGCLSSVVKDISSRLNSICKEVRQGGFINFGYPDRTVDASGIHATDIFRLSYNVQRPLSLIINRKVIRNLDFIFKRLIQGVRLSHWLKTKHGNEYYVKNKELRHFIACSINYMNFTIQTKWNKLLKTLHDMNFQEESSLQRVIDLFERTVSSISFNLFIEHETMDLLDSIYSCALDYNHTLHCQINKFITRLKTLQRDNNTSELNHFIDQLTFNGYFK